MKSKGKRERTRSLIRYAEVDDSPAPVGVAGKEVTNYVDIA